MSEFRNFRDQIIARFNQLVEEGNYIFVVNCDKDKLWDVYLSSFPEGANLIYRKRTLHDCSVCKQFIKQVGSVVGINKNYEIESIWEVKDIPEIYKPVARALSRLIKSSYIENIFLTEFKKIGIEENREILEDGSIIKYNHFYIHIPKTLRKKKDDIPALLNEYKTGKEVFKRGLEEITKESLEIVLDLISQNSLYRGDQYKNVLEQFLELKKEFDNVTETRKRDNFCWYHITRISQSVARIRNSAIGQLLLDISNSKDLTEAVTAYEKIVAPENYKRPKPIVTRKMIEQAEKKLKDLNLDKALVRRMAIPSDISVNNVLYVDRSTKSILKEGSIFESLKKEIPEVTNTKDFDKIESTSIDKFINDILPRVSSVEVLFENKHINNLMALTTSMYEDSPILFKWNNSFAWSYNGGLADSSIKQKVKEAGGSITGKLRISLHWFCRDDYDLHCICPCGTRIYYNAPNKRCSNCEGQLDVDMNIGEDEAVRGAVENITWENYPPSGIYEVIVRNFTYRESSIYPGFEVEIEYLDKTFMFKYNKPLRHKEAVSVARFKIGENSITFLKSIGYKELPKEVWNIKTQCFHKVNMITTSPNYWDEEVVGQKHYFFFIENCKPDKPFRGLFNEYLKENLKEHRRLFEFLADRLLVEPVGKGLAGLGFSATRRNNLILRVKGHINRLIKVNI